MSFSPCILLFLLTAAAPHARTAALQAAGKLAVPSLHVTAMHLCPSSSNGPVCIHRQQAVQPGQWVRGSLGIWVNSCLLGSTFCKASCPCTGAVVLSWCPHSVGVPCDLNPTPKPNPNPTPVLPLTQNLLSFSRC